MSKTKLQQDKETNEEVLSPLPQPTDQNNDETPQPMTEEEFKEQYQKLPLWQHVVLAILFLFGFTAVIMVIDFVVELFTELLQHMV